MTENEQAPGYEPRMAPPTQPGLTPRPPRKLSWPTVLGIISIIFGAGWALYGVWGIVSPVFAEKMAESVPGLEVAIAAAQKWAAWTLAISCTTLALGAILLASGVGLVKRARWSVSAIRIWAVVKIAVGVGSSILSTMVEQETLRAMSPQGFTTPWTNIVLSDVALCVLSGGWALPVFMLIWFGRKRIRNEVAGWSAGGSPDGRTTG